jgi:hypothetical protein
VVNTGFVTFISIGEPGFTSASVTAAPYVASVSVQETPSSARLDD